MSNKVKPIIEIAKVTFKELIQDRILYGAFICGLMLLGLGVLASNLALIKKDRVILDFGLMTVQIFCAFIAIFYSSNLIAREVERKTILLVLSRPVTKLQFLFGKMLGVIQVVFVNWVIFSALYLITLSIFGGGMSVTLFWGLVLAFFQSVLLSAIALFFSSFSTATLSVMFTLGVYLIGSNISQIRFIAEKSDSVFYQSLFNICSYIFPNMEFFQLGLNVTYGIHVSHWFGVLSILYALIVGFILLLFSSYFVVRRES